MYVENNEDTVEIEIRAILIAIYEAWFEQATKMFDERQFDE